MYSCNLPGCILRSTQAARCFLRSVRILMLLFQAMISTRTNTYVIFYHPLVYKIIHFISYRCQDILDIDTDISRKYRIIHRQFEVRYRTLLAKKSVPTYGGTQVFPQFFFYNLYILSYVHKISNPQHRADRIDLRVFPRRATIWTEST